jgi:hypothetical protein
LGLELDERPLCLVAAGHHSTSSGSRRTPHRGQAA